MVDNRVLINGQEVELTADLFQPKSANKGDNEAISRPSLTFWQDARRRLVKNPGAMIGLFIILCIVAMSFIAPALSDFTYDQQNIRHSKVPPLFPVISEVGIMDGTNAEGVNVYEEKGIEETYLFGTDSLGRDIWTRTWTGAQVSLLIALLAACFDLIIGVTYGSISGFFGGKVDIVMQRIIEVIAGIPSLVLVILFMMVFEPGIMSIAMAMAVSGWIGMSRIVRSHVLRLKDREFVLASRTLGSSNFRLITKHLFPNIAGPILVSIMFSLPSAIFYEAFLSFIGLGLQPPSASLGVLISEGYQSLQNYPYMLILPSIVLCLLIFSFNLLADGLRDAVDPQMRNQ